MRHDCRSVATSKQDQRLLGTKLRDVLGHADPHPLRAGSLLKSQPGCRRSLHEHAGWLECLVSCEPACPSALRTFKPQEGWGHCPQVVQPAGTGRPTCDRREAAQKPGQLLKQRRRLGDHLRAGRPERGGWGGGGGGSNRQGTGATPGSRQQSVAHAPWLLCALCPDLHRAPTRTALYAAFAPLYITLCCAVHLQYTCCTRTWGSTSSSSCTLQRAGGSAQHGRRGPCGQGVPIQSLGGRTWLAHAARRALLLPRNPPLRCARLGEAPQRRLWYAACRAAAIMPPPPSVLIDRHPTPPYTHHNPQPNCTTPAPLSRRGHLMPATASCTSAGMVCSCRHGMRGWGERGRGRAWRTGDEQGDEFESIHPRVVASPPAAVPCGSTAEKRAAAMHPGCCRVAYCLARRS